MWRRVNKLFLVDKKVFIIPSWNIYFDNIGDACDGLNIEKHITSNFVVFSFDLIARNSNKGGFILKVMSDGSVEKILKFQ